MPSVELMASNAEILDAIRNESSFGYQQRIPSATQGNIAEAISTLQTHRPLMNEFVEGLLNRIGVTVYRNRIWTNPLAQFKRGEMYYGDTIEEIFTDLIKSQRFDPNASHEDVFKRNKPNVRAAFHHIDRQDQYPITLEEKLLRRAFINESGLQTLVGSIMNSPYNSDSYDEYLIMRNLIAEFARNNQFHKVQIPDFTSSLTREADLKYTVELMKGYANRLQFMSKDFNAAGVTTFTPQESQVVFIDAALDAAIDVEVLAAAFNMDKAEYIGRRVLIDNFTVDGCKAVLADAELFVCADTLIDFGSIYNPKGLAWNSFLNHHGVYSVSRFANAIMFTFDDGSVLTLVPPTLSGVTIAADTSNAYEYAVKGGTFALGATVAGTGDFVPQGVSWAVVGSEMPTAMGTFVDAQGVLHVDAHEQNTWVEIMATTTYVDPATPLDEQRAFTDTITVGIQAALGDSTAPDAPAIVAATPTGISGTGEAGSRVTVTNLDTGKKATVSVIANGTWSTAANLGSLADHTVEAYQIDGNGNRSAVCAPFTVTAA